MNELKQRIIAAIDAARDDLRSLAHSIHSYPELGFEEHQAVGFISEVLAKHGFAAIKGYGGLETAFRADCSGRGNGSTVAFLAEYDALKGIGHGCGHNLIATCSTGAFLGVAAVMGELKGRVCLIGTPAEEGGSGKVIMLRNGAFDDVGYALMMHPAGSVTGNLVGRGGRAAARVDVAFHGKGAHSSVPQKGINALSALVQTFNQIDIMRPVFELQDNVNGIITSGGAAANIIPDYAAGAFSLRAGTMKRVEELIALVERCARNAEALTGARAEVTHGEISAERYPNRPMNQAFKDNMAELGVEMHWPDPKKQYGSSDIGNVSIKIPAIHDYLSIAEGASIKAHTAEFAVAAGSDHAFEVCLKGAKGLAMTACDILQNEAFRKEISAAHKEQIPKIYQSTK